MMDVKSSVTLDLLKYGLGKSEECHLPEKVDWHEVLDFSIQQGVTAIILDGVDKCFSNGIELNIGFQAKMEWIGTVSQMEQQYTHHKNVIKELASVYLQQDIRMMLMKGVGLSFDYPIPNHRPCGDIDIYLFGDLEKGDKLIREKYNIDIDHDQHKHTIFAFNGVTIENHYDFANYHKHRSSKKLDEWLKKETNNSVKTDNVWLPSANFNAIFLVRHAASHFAAEEITLRHLLDWAFFVEKHYDEVDWEWQWKVCQEQNMHKFLLAINDICVKILGFDNSKYKTGGETALTEMVLNEIMNPTYIENTPKGMMVNIMKRGQLWWRNRWKHKIVYPESLFSTFFQQVYAHLMKPATLKG